MIKVLKDRNYLSEFRQIWDELFEIDLQATPFQRFEYIEASLTFLETEHPQLYIIAVKDDLTNKWVAIFPFVLGKNGNLSFINARHSDFCAAIIHPDYNNYNLYKEVSDFISNDKNIKGLLLENVGPDSRLLATFKPCFRYMIIHDMNFYSSIPICQKPDDKDSMSAFRYVRAKQLKKLRKSKKQIEPNSTFEIRRSSEGHEYPQKEVTVLVNQMLNDGVRVKSYFSDEMLGFWKELYDRDVLCAALLYENGEIRTCNFMYYDEKRNEYIKWLMLYINNSWNMKINIMIADYLYYHGGGTINFARGIYDYKLTNFHPDVKPLFCVRIAKTPWDHIKNMLAVAFHYSKPIIKSMLGR